MSTLELLLVFSILCLASHRIGKWFTAVRLPYITGYLAVGAVAGGFVLDILPKGVDTDLRFVDEIALGLIAFVAGSELIIGELRERVRTIVSIAGGISLFGFVIIGTSVGVIASFAPFGDGLGRNEIFAAAILGGTVLLALSPPSTIAVIKEVGARGRFTSSVLSITVVMDVVVVIVFAASASVAGALLGTDGLQLVFVPILLLDLSLAVSIGFALGKFLALITRIRLPDIVIAGAILAIGYGVYEAADFVKSWSNTELGFEVYLEPLLLTLTAGATVANFTSRRARFEHVLGLVSPAVYVAFFTLTGLSLKLDTLIEILPVAMVVFLIRVVAIALGTTVGARIAREDGHLRNKSWLAMITQAGIALGLAREAAIQFPALGDSFATLIVAVIVLNEIFGPMLLKFVLGRVDEAGDKDGRRVLIHGIDRNAIRLAERLEGQGWSTQLSDTRADHVDEVDQTREWKVIARNTAKRYFAEIDELPDTVVAMSGDDESNLELCRAATEAGVARTVARVQESGLLDDFHEIGTLVIDPTRAAVALFEDAVRTPDAAELVLHNDANRETRQVRIRSRFAHGRSVRDLRLPAGVLVLAIRRDGATVTPDGFTRVRRGDDVTLIGEPGLLREATNRLTY